jgi:predicted hydrocarbon binding protein/predicted amino acid-binding ACT domain protein
MSPLETIPVEVTLHVHIPGTNPYVFYLELSKEALEAVGILERVAHIFAERGIPILQLSITASGVAGRITVIVFVDLKEEELARGLVSELEKVPYALHVSYSKPVVSGFAYCNRCFPPTVRGQRAIIFSKQVYEGFFREGWERFGTAFPVLLYTLGFQSGRLAYESHMRIAGGNAQAAVKVAEAFFQLLGYGKLEVLRIDDARREAVVRFYDNFECELFKGAGEIRAGITRGFVGGWLAARWGVSKAEEVIVREEKCIARGDPYCEARVWVEKR